MRNRAMKYLSVLLLMIAAAASLTVAAQSNDKKIADQRKKIAELERQIAEEQKKIKTIGNDKSKAQERIRSLSRQIQARNDLLDANERQSRLLQAEVDRTDSAATALSSRLERLRGQYVDMIRETYRNYRNDNYISYIFSADGFLEMARRIAILREVAVKRGERIEEIRILSGEVAQQREILNRRQQSLDSVKMKINAEKSKMQSDVKSAKASVQQLTNREKQALKNKSDQERRLSIARDELQKLTKGNKVGESFSKSSKINLPVEGGTRGRIVAGVCEIFGKRGARVNSVYDGKVVAIKSAGNNRYEVYIAHGERVSSYSNLSEVSVAKNQTVKRDQQIGTIGSWVNPLKSEPEYKILFQLISPSGNETFSLEKMFSK